MSDTKLIKPLLITFASTHLPLGATIGYGFIYGSDGLLPIIGVILVSNLVATALSLLQVYSLGTRPRIRKAA